jgi:hypothetical protein
MSTCLHRFTPDTNLVQTKIGAVETFAKLFFGKSKPFSVIYEPSYLGFSEEICRIFQPPPLTYHAYYAPHTPYTNLLGHHFGSSSGLAWFGRFGPVWVESAPRCQRPSRSHHQPSRRQNRVYKCTCGPRHTQSPCPSEAAYTLYSLA